MAEEIGLADEMSEGFARLKPLALGKLQRNAIEDGYGDRQSLREEQRGGEGHLIGTYSDQIGRYRNLSRMGRSGTGLPISQNPKIAGLPLISAGKGVLAPARAGGGKKVTLLGNPAKRTRYR